MYVYTHALKKKRHIYILGGSDANDTAIKMVWYYHNALGQPQKKKIIARHKGYHGVTAVAASCSGLPGLHNHFGAAGKLTLQQNTKQTSQKNILFTSRAVP